MKQNNAPDNLVDRTYNLLTKAGVALAVYPTEPLSDGTPQKMALLITTQDTNDASGLASVVKYKSISGVRQKYRRQLRQRNQD